MNRNFFLIPLLMSTLAGSAALADPIHASAGGAFWHHDSGWIFPERIGEFVRVGIPQDIAGSRDAVAHYARVANGVRTTASVDVYPTDSAAEHSAVTGDSFPVTKDRALPAIRNIELIEHGTTTELVGVYFVVAGEWRIRIRISSPLPDAAPIMDAFVLAQRWETLNGAT